MAGRGILSPIGRPKSDRADGRRIPVGRRLFSGPATSSNVACKQTWSKEEDKALVEFVLFHSDPAVWPSHSKKSKFWKDAATFVQQRSKASVQRNATACRIRVVSKYPKQFSCPADAENHYFSPDSTGAAEMQPVIEQKTMPITATAETTTVNSQEMCTQTEGLDVPVTNMDRVATAISLLKMASDEELMRVVSHLFQQLALTKYGVHIPADFLQLSLIAVRHLNQCGRSNVVYGVAKAIGTMRPDESDSRLPARRMPMGLLEYMVNFFNSNTYLKIGPCPPDYKLWLTTMYCQFGNKWANLHLGPMWSSTIATEPNEQAVFRSTDPLNAKVNIPGISSRSIRKYIAVSGVTTNAQIQEYVLDEAAKFHANTWWWLKADACDLVSGLSESMKGVWSGDVDLNDGGLDKQYKNYKSRLSCIQSLKIRDASHPEGLYTQLNTIAQQVKDDLQFLHTTLSKAQADYEDKIIKSSNRSQDKTLFKLAWQVHELEELIKEMRQIAVELSTLIGQVLNVRHDLVKENFAKNLTSMRVSLEEAVKKLIRHQRTAATHIMVFMISPESRNHKPYALPVQCLPITSLKDQQCRELANKVIAAMVKRNMKVVGFTTDGEFNSLRWKGNTRPLTVLQVKTDARKVYQSKGLKTLMSMLTPLGNVNKNGCIQAKTANPAVPDELLWEIHRWRMEGATDVDVITRLRQRTVPTGYCFHTWCPGKTETQLEMLRSILAQLHYHHEILKWESKGVPFRSHLYVPEHHPLTGMPFHEREDEAHVLKRIAQSLRDGGPIQLKLERFLEAVYDPSTKLSYHALIGTRKQSVSDVEQIFSSRMLNFFESKGYTTEAEYVRVIRNWRRASDERGLSDELRSQYNQNLLSYILDELMPWYCKPGMRDFSLLEVNQSVTNIRGFTRETLSALLVNIESREWRHTFNSGNNIAPEHPRACSTDDVECFFSVLRDMVGKDFTHKQVMFGWRKAVEELTKRLDPELPFYYHTSTHHRFYEGELPDFSKPPIKSDHKIHVSRRELLTNKIGGRSTLAQHGAMSIRTQYHNVPVELPPPPASAVPAHLAEHSYFSL